MLMLKTIVKSAAKSAYDAGISAGNQDQLVAWIRANCRYRSDSEFFLVLLIGSDLADLQAQAEGYPHEVARAYAAAESKVSATSIEEWKPSGKVVYL